MNLGNFNNIWEVTIFRIRCEANYYYGKGKFKTS